jgi:hypothetical protein
MVKVAPRRLPFTATQITADNMAELAKKHERELYATDANTFIDWDEDTVLGVGDYIVTDADDKLVGAHDGIELLQNYTIEEE